MVFMFFWCFWLNFTRFSFIFPQCSWNFWLVLFILRCCWLIFHGLSGFSIDFIDVAMVFIKVCMCSLIPAWFYKVYLGIHDVHKSSCKYLDINPNIYIYLYTKLYVYIIMIIKLSLNNYLNFYVYITKWYANIITDVKLCIYNLKHNYIYVSLLYIHIYIYIHDCI